MDVRPAAPADSEVLLDLKEDFHRFEGIPWTRDAARGPLSNLLAAPTLGVVGLCEIGGEAAGYFVLSFGLEREGGGRDAFLAEIYLRPRHRGAGLGRLLLAEAEAFARARNVHTLRLSVRAANEPALRLYRSAGYADTGDIALSKPLR